MIRILQSWGVPVMMAFVYSVLMWSSETDNTGKAWMAIGLAMVLVVWWLFRTLTAGAALSRAVAVGDTTRTLELVAAQLASKKQPAARATLLVMRARALELRGDWAGVLTALDEAALAKLPHKQRTSWRILATSARIGACIEAGTIAEARRLLDAELTPAAATLDRRIHRGSLLHVSLAAGRIAAAEGRTADAVPLLQAVLDEVLAGGAERALAHFYLARLAPEPAAAASHRAEIAKLIPDETAWIRTGR
ncbi:MAG: hypothetical protein H0T42_15660 [Deltaproteobacteria bacterium]|nr:hypothetical protein [Deltaproteobacteria bacterium]